MLVFRLALDEDGIRICLCSLEVICAKERFESCRGDVICFDTYEFGYNMTLDLRSVIYYSESSSDVMVGSS